MNRRTIMIALVLIVLAGTVLMTYFGSLEDTSPSSDQAPNPAPTMPVQ
ncbi:hypothetical protein ACFOYU_13200 [Microvirga sp. GCM10011540]